MGKFLEKKAEIAEAAKASNRKTFNENDFNELGTALLNDAAYTTTAAVVENGVTVEKQVNPVADLRKSIITSVAKAAGCDNADQQKLVEEHQFNKLPLFDYVSELIESYCDTGKVIQMRSKPDFRATIAIEKQAEAVKEVKTPQTQEVKTCKYSAYRRIRSSSIPSYAKHTTRHFYRNIPRHPC